MSDNNITVVVLSLIIVFVLSFTICCMVLVGYVLINQKYLKTYFTYGSKRKIKRKPVSFV